MKRLQSGSVLLIGLLLFGLLAAFVLVQLDMLFWYRKAFQSTQIRQENRMVLERLLSDLASSLPTLSGKSCIVKDSNDPDDALTPLKSPKACVYEKNHQSFSYWIEDLGEKPCVQTRINGATYSTHHWRVTAGTVDMSLQIIQIQVATRALLLSCLSEPRMIELGIQSWRTV